MIFEIELIWKAHRRAMVIRELKVRIGQERLHRGI